MRCNFLSARPGSSEFVYLEERPFSDSIRRNAVERFRSPQRRRAIPFAPTVQQEETFGRRIILGR